jgi:catechol 2,3-dioxygenase-like lactoylglutathione lyase family enzyme
MRRSPRGGGTFGRRDDDSLESAGAGDVLDQAQQQSILLDMADEELLFTDHNDTKQLSSTPRECQIFAPSLLMVIYYTGKEICDMKIHKIDHVGIVVNDLAAAKAFFLDLGLDVQGEAELEGSLVDQVVGLHDVKTAIVWLRSPDGQAALELIKFYTPSDEKGAQHSSANTLGLRHIAFAVEDIEAIVAKLKKNGTEIFSEIQNYEDSYKLCYVRGPEGIILELAEQIN